MTLAETLEEFRNLGLLEYGSVVDGNQFRELCGIETIEEGTIRDFNSMALQELKYSDYIKSALLREGKYFKSTPEGYRVLLPSENAAQVRSYMESADRKLQRGIMLDRNTPAEFKITDNEATRAFMKLQSRRR